MMHHLNCAVQCTHQYAFIWMRFALNFPRNKMLKLNISQKHVLGIGFIHCKLFTLKLVTKNVCSRLHFHATTHKLQFIHE